MTEKIEGFYWDGGFPTARFRDARLRGLAGLLTSDIQCQGAGSLEQWAYFEERQRPGAGYPHPCRGHLPL